MISKSADTTESLETDESSESSWPSKLCRACKSEIDINASVCGVCQRDQGHLLSFVNRTTGLLAAAGVAVTVYSAISARSDAINAEEALTKSEEALASLEIVSAEVKNVAAETVLAKNASEAALHQIETIVRRFTISESIVLNSYIQNVISEAHAIGMISTYDIEPEKVRESNTDALSNQAKATSKLARFNECFDSAISVVQQLSNAYRSIENAGIISGDDGLLVRYREQICSALAQIRSSVPVVTIPSEPGGAGGPVTWIKNRILKLKIAILTKETTCE